MLQFTDKTLKDSIVFDNSKCNLYHLYLFPSIGICKSIDELVSRIRKVKGNQLQQELTTSIS